MDLKLGLFGLYALACCGLFSSVYLYLGSGAPIWQILVTLALYGLSLLIGVAYIVPALRSFQTMEGGLQGWAEVFELTPVLSSEGNRVQFRLRVRVDGQAPYEVEHTAVVHVLHAHLLRVGTRVDVLVDAENPKRLRITNLDEQLRLLGQQHALLEQKTTP